jgi:hypothetical protein
MKTLIILVLLVVLAIGSFLSKPSQENFVAYMKAQTQASQPTNMQTLGQTILNGLIADAGAAAMKYNDHILWATEDLDGQPKYVGAFGHWWKKGS